MNKHMSFDPRLKTLAPVRTKPLFDMMDDLEPRLDIGQGPRGRRMFWGVSSGRFEGERLRGEVLRGGGDWGLYGPTGTLAIDVRLQLRTDDGALILMTYQGRLVIPPELRDKAADPETRQLLDPASYYYRTSPLFETGAEKYAWLNDRAFIGLGYIVNGGVAYQVHELL